MKKAVVMGAAGRDFHNFNVYLRDNPNFQVVAFTAAQIPDIAGRKYPPVLAGKLYPDGIPIVAEEELVSLIKNHGVTKVYFSYSDVAHEEVMHKASLAQSAGASFLLLGPQDTMVKSHKPVVSVCAVRTGSGKSQTSRKAALILKKKGRSVTVVRHPMPYGDLVRQRVQRFATYEDLDEQKCTIEEREEYEPHIRNGIIVYAGVDTEAVLRQAEKESDVILWDGGNNDFPFVKSDLEIVVVDPHRPGHELLYYPGETNFRRAGVLIINKMNTAPPGNVDLVMKNIRAANPEATVIRANSRVSVEDGERIRGKAVLVIEDGPTVTHGGMAYGAGVVIAREFGAARIVDPRPAAVGSIKTTFEKYRHLETVLPAMGYGEAQVRDLSATIDRIECDLIVSGTPIDLKRLIKPSRPLLQVTYDLEEIGSPTLEDALGGF